ncbi:MAG: class IIb bacteriocin, lactobin A/cerein 7B family [Planctomycetota bacterium]|nr:class IIb bacteriocin, lactobin A/cerein 7B family [Planctomycetota bacterium]
MTDDKKKKHDDKDREKLSDEEMEDVDGGVILAAFAISNAAKQKDEELKAKSNPHNSGRSNKG